MVLSPLSVTLPSKKNSFKKGESTSPGPHAVIPGRGPVVWTSLGVRARPATIDDSDSPKLDALPFCVGAECGVSSMLTAPSEADPVLPSQPHFTAGGEKAGACSEFSETAPQARRAFWGVSWVPAVLRSALQAP